MGIFWTSGVIKPRETGQVWIYLGDSWKRKRVTVSCNSLIYGTPGRIRTYDLRIRSPLLYPAELQAQIVLI